MVSVPLIFFFPAARNASISVFRLSSRVHKVVLHLTKVNGNAQLQWTELVTEFFTALNQSIR